MQTNPLAPSLLALSLLSGCASQGLSPEQQAALSQQASKKTLEISCDGPCSLSYQDPRDRLKLPRNTNGWDVANSLISTAGSVALGTAPWAAVSKIAADGYNRAGGNYQYNNSYNQDSTHTPVVVNAPDPVVVTQPAPTIVSAPDPIIVTQPVAAPDNTP